MERQRKRRHRIKVEFAEPTRDCQGLRRKALRRNVVRALRLVRFEAGLCSAYLKRRFFDVTGGVVAKVALVESPPPGFEGLCSEPRCGSKRLVRELVVVGKPCFAPFGCRVFCFSMVVL